jgi:hypothetical protein
MKLIKKREILVTDDPDEYVHPHVEFIPGDRKKTFGEITDHVSLIADHTLRSDSQTFCSGCNT